MANAMFGKGREGFLAGDIDWDADDIRAILIDTGDYAVDINVHDNLDDVAGASRVAVTAAFSGKTVALGVADAADIAFATVTGDQSEAVIIYQHTGVESTSRLIAYIDTGTGFPITPNGGNILITWDAAGIFTL